MKIIFQKTKVMSILKRPIVTEKMTDLGELPNKQYGFVVAKSASKPEIRKEIERLYEVNVASIRTMVYAGKKRSRFTKAGIIQGKSPNFKKAIVTLKDGQEIDFYKNI